MGSFRVWWLVALPTLPETPSCPVFQLTSQVVHFELESTLEHLALGDGSRFQSLFQMVA